MNRKSSLICLLAALVIYPGSVIAVPPLILNSQERLLVEGNEIIVREIPVTGKEGRAFEAIGRIQAPLEKIVAVLTDYEKYPEFMPNVSQVDIVGKPDGDVVLQYTLTLPLGRIKKYRLRMTVNSVDSQTGIISWQMVPWRGLRKSETIRNTTGYWLLKQESSESVMVLYHVYTDPGAVPRGLGWVVNILTEKSVPDALQKTRERVLGLEK